MELMELPEIEDYPNWEIATARDLLDEDSRLRTQLTKVQTEVERLRRANEHWHRRVDQLNQDLAASRT